MRVCKKEGLTLLRLTVGLVVTVILMGYLGCAGTTSQPTLPVSVNVKQTTERTSPTSASRPSWSVPSWSRSTPAAPSSESGKIGTYWALIIGINQYADPRIPTLTTAVTDAEGVRDVLTERYGFEPQKVITLLNEHATRENIEEALIRLGEQTTEHDSVLVYYAGHGQYNRNNKLGWWIPVEAVGRKRGTFIANATIRDYLAAMQARHVYLIADSCFSGTLFASTRGNFGTDTIDDKYYRRLSEQRSRWGFTSGGVEPVADGGKDGHSIFAYHFIKFLEKNNDPYVVPSGIADTVIPLVTRNSEQLPRSQPLYGAGDEGGQFLFRLASYIPEPALTPALVITPLVTAQIQHLENSLREAMNLLQEKETSAKSEKRKLTGALEEQREQIEQLTVKVQRVDEHEQRATTLEEALKKARTQMVELSRSRAEEEKERAREEAENLLHIQDLEDRLQQAEQDKNLVQTVEQELKEARAQLVVFTEAKVEEQQARTEAEAKSVARIQSLGDQLKKAEAYQERARTVEQELTQARLQLAQLATIRAKEEQARVEGETVSVVRIQALEAQVQQAKKENKQALEVEQRLAEARAKLEEASRTTAKNKRAFANEEQQSKARIQELEKRIEQAKVEKQRAEDVEEQLVSARTQLEALDRDKGDADRARANQEAKSLAKIRELEDRLRKAETEKMSAAALDKELAQAQAQMKILDEERVRAEQVRAAEGMATMSQILELENQIQQIEEEHARELAGYVNKIENLERTVVSLRERTDQLPPVIPIGIGF